MSPEEDSELLEGFIIEDLEHTVDEPAEEEPAADPASAFLEKLKNAYSDFFEKWYEPMLSKNNRNEIIYPSIHVPFEDDDLELIFDFDLFEQLFDVYVTDGWAGINVLEKKLLEGGTVDAESLKNYLLKKPVKLNQWNYTVLLFNFTKKMLALVIRESLIRVEQRSGQMIYDRLHFTYAEISKAWKAYGIQTKKITTKSDSLKGHDVPESSTRYSIGEKYLAKDVFDLLTLTVTEQKRFLLFLETYTTLQDRITRAESTEFPRRGENNTYDRDVKKLKELGDIRSVAEQYLNMLTELISKQHPMALLIHGLLKEKFEQPDMENLLGATLDGIKTEIEALVKEIRADNHFVEQIIPFNETDDTIKDIFAFHVPSHGLETEIIETAIANFKDRNYISLLSDANFIQLFDSDTIAVDSVEFIAGQHYLLELTLKLDAISAEENKNTEHWKNIQKTSSALSLATFVTPQTAVLFPFIRGAGVIAGIAVLIHTASTITESIQQSDNLIKNALLTQQGSPITGLRKLGDTILLRKKMYQSMTEEAAVELLGILVSGTLPGFRHAILLDGYCNDIETLMADD